MTLGLRDRRSEASLRLRNRSEITVLECEQEPYLHGMMFRGDAKDIRYGNVNIALR